MHRLVPPTDPHAEYFPLQNVLNYLPDGRWPAEDPTVQTDFLEAGPLLQAATIADVRIIRGLLQSGFPPTHYVKGPVGLLWQSALTNAILAGPGFAAQSQLLAHGADPTGFPADCYHTAATRFVRGRHPRDTYCESAGQDGPGAANAVPEPVPGCPAQRRLLARGPRPAATTPGHVAPHARLWLPPAALCRRHPRPGRRAACPGPPGQHGGGTSSARHGTRPHAAAHGELAARRHVLLLQAEPIFRSIHIVRILSAEWAPLCFTPNSSP